MAGRILLISAWCCTVVGCGNSGSNSTRSSSAVSKEDGTKTVDPSTDLAKMTEAKTAVTEFVNQAKAGKLTADSITDDFKKVIGEPLTPSEREKGFSDSSATDWLKLVGPRLQSANIVGVSNAMGYFVLDSGTLRMVNTDSKWRIDWFHVGRPKDAAAITADKQTRCD